MGQEEARIRARLGLFYVAMAGFLAAGGGAQGADFRLRPEWTGPCARAETVDVNLGNSPEAFVRAAFCQITGREPDTDLVRKLSQRLRSDERLRRVDVVRSLAQEQGRPGCALSYSSPWLTDPDLPPPADPRN